ncbi:hypothetical protein BKA93DRAFT_751361 [Sparassis latifolia]
MVGRIQRSTNSDKRSVNYKGSAADNPLSYPSSIVILVAHHFLSSRARTGGIRLSNASENDSCTRRDVILFTWLVLSHFPLHPRGGYYLYTSLAVLRMSTRRGRRCGHEANAGPGQRARGRSACSGNRSRPSASQTSNDPTLRVLALPTASSSQQAINDGNCSRPSASQTSNDLTSRALALLTASSSQQVIVDGEGELAVTDELKAFDGILATDFPLREEGVITTPNATYIPEFPVIRDGQIVTRQDGRWGPQEYSRWPQMYDCKVIHHMCIPTLQSVVEADAMVLWDTIRVWEWEVDTTCGVPELGFLVEDKLKALTEMALQKNKAGMQLLLMLAQCLDRLHLLPTSCNHAIALGAHVQCLTLELWGYVNYYSVVVGHLETLTLHGSADWDILPVRGAFTNDASVTQSLFRVGVPFWFIQTKTDKMRIKKNETDLAGILNRPEDWPSRMLHEATNAVCDACLPPLEGASKSSSAEQPPQKKQKDDKQPSIQQGDGNVKSQASHSVAESSKKSKWSHRGTRGKKNHHVEGSSMEMSQPAHPSLAHECSTLIGAAWNAALSAVPPLAAPALDDAVDGGSAITASGSVDASVEGEMGATEGPICTSDAAGPMSQVNSASKAGSAKKVKDRHERQQNIRRLFTATGRMSSYIKPAQPHFGMDLISADDVDELCKKLLWEVHETNWHCELRVLDACLLDMSKWSSMHRWEHEVQLAKVWDKQDSSSGLTVAPFWNSRDVVFCWRWPELPEGL